MASVAGVGRPEIARIATTGTRPTTATAIRHGLVVVGVLYAFVYLVIHVAGTHTDAHDYWATTLDTIYEGYVVGGSGYAYSPVFALAIAPLTALPWPAFYAAWVTAMAMCALWLVAPAPTAWKVPLLLLTVPELLTGNIHLLLAVAVVVAFQHASSSAVLLLTKVTCAVSVVWFAARGEWGRVATVVFVVVVAASLAWAVAPDLWPRWLEALAANAAATGPAILDLPLIPRLAIATGAVVFAARRSQPWLVPVGVLLAMPHIYLQSLVVLLACVRLAMSADTDIRRQAVAATPAERAATAAAPSS